MGSDSNPGTAPSSPSTSAAAASSGKRGRDVEDEVYVDNLRSHKRYLSEIMASSLNGLTVGEESLMDSHSPARSESIYSLRDEMPWQYSPMSEDSDDSRFCEASNNICSSQPDSLPTSPVSPYRCQKQQNIFTTTSSYYSNGCNVAGLNSTQSRNRSSDSEGRLPSSPSDICHSADLRRAALLRSVQMRTQPSGSSTPELPFGPGQEPVSNIEHEERPNSYTKSLVEEREYPIVDCPSLRNSEPEFSGEGPCRMLDMNIKAEEPGG